MNIYPAEKKHSSQIAKLIMQAMNYDCCRHFMGGNGTLKDFERIMANLVEREDTQYSYLNTLIIKDTDDCVCGICVSYDGARLHELRPVFVETIKDVFNKDFSDMTDETEAGELYIDSIAVEERFRGKGFATKLLYAARDKAAALKLPYVGLLVDKGNPEAEKLYTKTGFVHVGDNMWGGHQMKHLQLKAI